MKQGTRKKSKVKKSFEFYFDNASERFVFEIQDPDAMFPLLIKGLGVERSYELIRTQKGKLQLR